MDKRLLTVVLAAVLVALVITAIFYQITERRPAQAAVDTKLLVVAKADLPMGAVITENDLRVIDFPENAYPRDGYQEIAEVVDRSVTQQILSNEAITASRVTEKGAGFGLAPLIPDGYRAVAIAVNQVSGVSGFLMPGSKVDVLLSAIPRGGEERLTTTVLENISVLSTGQKQQPDANGQPQNVPVVNLLLTPEDSELLTLATQEGKIQLTLRNPLDKSTYVTAAPPPPEPAAQKVATTPRPGRFSNPDRISH